MSSRDNGVPNDLKDFFAVDFLNVKDRIHRTSHRPDFAKLVQVDPHSSADDRIFAVAKAGLLLVEAALPIGSVNTNSIWKPDYASQWRLMVQKATGPWELMRCLILLEDVITEEWIQPEIGHLRSCLPGRWKALDEASPSSLAMRVILLDRGILYGTVDKKRFRSKSKKS